MILLDLDRVSASRPGKALFTDLSVTVSSGERLGVGVVGPNGTGKSTLLRVMAGLAKPESGAVRRGRDVRNGCLEQHPVLPAGTGRDAVGSAVGGGGTNSFTPVHGYGPSVGPMRH